VASSPFLVLPCREEIELRFDRPFVFAVVHRASRLALFCGEVHQPEAWKEE
jgi:serine protease inhibitor